MKDELESPSVAPREYREQSEKIINHQLEASCRGTTIQGEEEDFELFTETIDGAGMTNFVRLDDNSRDDVFVVCCCDNCDRRATHGSGQGQPKVTRVLGSQWLLVSGFQLDSARAA